MCVSSRRGGAVSCIDNLLALVLKLNALSVTTPLGIGLVSPYHPQFRGVIGFCGHASAMNAIQSHEVDTVVAVGNALQETATNAWTVLSSIGARMMHVDDCVNNLIKSPLAKLHVLGNLTEIFAQVIDSVENQFASTSNTNGREKYFCRT